MKIIAAGLPLRIKARLIGRMKDAEVTAVNTADEVMKLVSAGGISLVVLYEGLEGGAVETLRSMRRTYHGPVLFCADKTHTGSFLGELQRLRVTAIFQQPIDPDELVRRAAMELAVKAPPTEIAAAASCGAGGIPEPLQAVWKKHEVTNQTRVATLFEACDIGLTALSEQDREIAQRAAHQLAGTLGTFSLVQATLLAREAESILRNASAATPAQQARLRLLAHALEIQIADPSVTMSPPEESGDKGIVLILAPRNEDTEVWVKAISEVGWQALATRDVSGARKLLALENPKCFVVDLGTPDDEDFLALIREVQGRGSTKHIVALMPKKDWCNLTGCFPVIKPAGPERIIEALEATPRLRVRQEGPRACILAVDDDPIVLESISAILQNSNADVHTLQDPLQFWDVLKRVSPDLLILDVDLPLLSGVEICRAVRADSTYARLPILFLSAYSDGETVHRVFQAGGDDYVYKPVVGPELLTRVANRLERARARLAKEAPDSARGGSREVVKRTISLVIPDNATAAPLISGLIDLGLQVDRLTEKGDELIRTLTCAVEKRPHLLLLGVEDSLDLLGRLDGLGVTATTEVWIHGPFSEEAAAEVFERGGCGFIPDIVSLPKLLKRLQRVCVS